MNPSSYCQSKSYRSFKVCYYLQFDVTLIASTVMLESYYSLKAFNHSVEFSFFARAETSEGTLLYFRLKNTTYVYIHSNLVFKNQLPKSLLVNNNHCKIHLSMQEMECYEDLGNGLQEYIEKLHLRAKTSLINQALKTKLAMSEIQIQELKSTIKTLSSKKIFEDADSSRSESKDKEPKIEFPKNSLYKYFQKSRETGKLKDTYEVKTQISRFQQPNNGFFESGEIPAISENKGKVLVQAHFPFPATDLNKDENQTDFLSEVKVDMRTLKSETQTLQPLQKVFYDKFLKSNFLKLTPHGITKIMNGADPLNFQPIVQIVGIVRQRSHFILNVSDGEKSQQAVYMSTEFKAEFEKKKIAKNHVIKLIDYCVCVKLQHYTFYIFQFEQKNISDSKIGKPMQLKIENFKEKPHLYTPILQLQNNKSWIIKARVLEKNEIQYWDNLKSNEGYFKILIIDQDGAKAQGIFSHGSAKRFFSFLNTGKIYSFRNGTVKVLKAKFNNIEVDFEIEFKLTSSIIELEEDNEIPTRDILIPSIENSNLEISLYENSPKEVIESEKPLILTTFAQIEHMKNSQTSPYSERYNVLCTIASFFPLKIQEKMYPGCLNSRCKKRVVELNHGIFYCSKCDKEYQSCNYLYKLLLPLIDSTQTFYVKVLNSMACSLIGLSAEELRYLNSLDSAKAEDFLFRIYGKKIVAQIQARFEKDGVKEYVLISAKSEHTAMQTLLKDIGEISALL